MKSSHKIILFVFAPILALLTFLAWWMLSPSWSSLFSYELSDGARVEVVDALNKNNIEYRVERGSNKITVRSEDLSSIRKYLSENNIPRDSGNGLEIFSNKDYGLSEFAQNINFQRGLEEELARTIRRIQNVKSVRVHLTLKKESLFADRKKEPRASVILSFNEEGYFDTAKVRGIQEIVSSAVPDLKADNVVVVTDKGQTLSGGDYRERLDGGVSSVEDKYNRILESILIEVVGEGNFKSAVTIHYDFKKKKTVAENYVPSSEKGSGFLVSRKKITKKTGNSKVGDHENGSDTEEEEFIFSKEISEIEYPVGEITGVNVGVAIATQDEELIDNLTKLIETSLGMDSKRGDKVTIIKYKPLAEAPSFIESLPVKSDSAESSEENVATRAFTQYQIPLIGLAVGLFLVGLLLGILAKKLFFRQKRLSDEERQEIMKDLAQWMQ